MLLENFLESIESLPVDTKRNLTLIGELDKRATEAVDDAKHKVDEYLKQVHIMRPSERNAHIEEMNKRFQEAIDLTEQKQAVALQTYQLIDKHIRRLDANLAALAQELDDDQASACSSEKRTKNQPATSSKQSRGATSRSSSSRKRPLNESSRNQPRRGRKPKRKRVEDEAADERAAAKERESDADGGLSEDEAVSRSIPAAAKLALSVGQKPEELLLAVDPNEPVYCICKRVSYGEMIACDNQDCVTEWYHLDCVNLKVIPRGKWYCPTCRSERDGKF